MLSYEAEHRFLQSLNKGEPETLARVIHYALLMQIVHTKGCMHD